MEAPTGEMASLMLNLNSLSRRRELRTFRNAGRVVTVGVGKDHLYLQRFITTHSLYYIGNTK